MKKDIGTLIPEMHDADARQALAECVFALFDRWKLGESDQAALLNLSEGAALKPLRRGVPLADDPDILERAGHLLAIDRLLGKIYPEAPRIRDQWIRMRDKGLNDQSPLEVIRRQGIEGLRELRGYLEKSV